MAKFLFSSDLHGKKSRYEKLFHVIREERPDGLFLGGDLLPSGWSGSDDVEDFLYDFLVAGFEYLKSSLREDFPRIFCILGNDDPRFEEPDFMKIASTGLWSYMHNRSAKFLDYNVFGYSYVPPSPFLKKDWEKYDVSRFVDPGCVSPEEGLRSTQVCPHSIRYSTIQKDLDTLTQGEELSRTIFLFHAPPYSTGLDRADLDGKMIDHVPIDPHVGSIAIKRFIETKQPLITLHGHIHESYRLTGKFKERLGKTVMLQGAHDGPELCLITFDPEDPWNSAKRQLL